MKTLRFGPFDFNPQSLELRKSGTPVRLQAQPARVLGLLLSHAGHLVTRREIQQEVWGENVVEFDQGLNFCIRQIRIALEDPSETPIYIETAPRQGYRFIAGVSEADDDESRAQSVPPPEPVEERVEGAPLPSSLRRPWAKMAAVAAVFLLLAAAAFQARRAPKPAAEGRRMLAVLPFDNFTGDPGQEYFCDGLTEELIAALSRANSKQLGVIARTSAMRYKTDREPVSQIQKDLGIDYLIEGSVRNESGRFRITAQLIRASDQSHLWALSFDRKEGNTLELQREVSEAVVRSLALEFGDVRPQAPALPHPGAHEAFLQGRYHLAKGSAEAISRALELFEQSIGLEPDYAAAHAGRAEALLRQNSPPREKSAQVSAALKRALELDDTLAEAHLLAAERAMRLELDWPLARKEFERALELEPGRARSHHEFAFYFSDLGLHDEAIARVQRALELDPVSPLVQGDVAWIYLRAHRYEDAVLQARRTLELEPGDIGAHFCLHHTYLRQGKEREALEEALSVMRLAGASPGAIAEVKQKGVPAYREWELKLLLDREKRGFSDPAVLAMTYADLGQKEKAIESLLRAEAHGSSFLASLRSEPRFDPLRTDPRFTALESRVFSGM